MAKKKLPVSLFELVWYPICALVILWGITYVVLGLVNKYNDLSSLDTFCKGFKSLFKLDLYFWGLIIVAIGAGSSVKGGKSAAINKFLGDISYPIYITHYPLIYMQMSWAESHKDAPLGMHIFVAVCIFFLAIGLAYAALKLYDLPVREWLKGKLFSAQKD